MSERSAGVESASATIPTALRGAARRWLGGSELDILARRLLSPRPTDGRAAAVAEAAVAQLLLSRGCALRFEVPTPNGRSCDFEVRHGALRFFVHVKRLRGAGAVRLTAPAALRRLEAIGRPYVVLVRWLEPAAPRKGPRIGEEVVRQAEAFVRSAQLGDEAILRDGERPVARLRVLAHGPEPHVVVALAMADLPDDRAFRAARLLRKAYQQFMPGAENVILLCADLASEHDIETVLRGTHIERWDRLPRRGERVALGRADDGLWHGRHFERSRVVGRFEVDGDGTYRAGALHVCDAATEDIRAICGLLGDAPAAVRSPASGCSPGAGKPCPGSET